MTVKTLTPVRLNLVAPLAHEATDMHLMDTAASGQARSRAVSTLVGTGLRRGDVVSANDRSSLPAPPGTRTSTTATRTTTTRSSRPVREPAADSTPFSFESLVRAYLDCRRHKRSSASCQAFEAHLESHLCELYEELLSGAYKPGRSICFVITRPKPREVWAAEFRDRIVHHLLYNHIAPRFHAAFSVESCACIPGRGTLYGARRLEGHVRSATENWRKPASYLKMDVANFFVSISKPVLFAQLLGKVHEPFWRWLAQTILFHDPRGDVEVRGRPEKLALVPPHKSLFNAPQDHGLPIGNLSSQFFANVHMDALDQFAKHQVRARRFVRYVDDFVLVHEDPHWLHAAHQRIAQFLPERLGLRLNESKTILQPVSRGVDFVGHVILPHRRVTRRRALRSALNRLEHMPAGEVYASGNSYFGLVRQAGNSHHEQALIARALLKRGHAVDGGLTRAFRRHAA